MEVLFHIGAPKAGSTAIQEMLQLNAEPLAAQDILAWSPAQTVKDQARLLADRFLPPNRPLLPIERVHFRNWAETITRSHDAWTDIAAQVKRLRPRLTILSSEAMMAVSHPSHVIAALSEIFERITILVYIRDPVEQYRSGIDQVIRGGGRLCDLPLPADFSYPDISILQRYQTILGKDRLVLRNFERGNLAGGDLLEDFSGCIARLTGLVPDLRQRPEASNESLAAAATVWLLGANETFIRFTEGDDRSILRRRREVIQRLRMAEALRGQPRLRLEDPLLCDWVRHAARRLIYYCNTHFSATGQQLLPAPPQTVDLPPPHLVRHRLRDWLFGSAAGSTDFLNVMQAVSDHGATSRVAAARQTV